MAFNTQELESIADSALDYYFDKGEQFYNHIQSKPLLANIEANAKTFSGGKGDISLGVKGDFGFPVDRTTGNPVTTPAGGVDALTGFTHDDQLKFYTPANNRRANFPWREHHLGITVTHTEMKIDGLSVTDEWGEGISRHSGRDMHVLTELFDSKLDDLGEKYARDMNNLLWGDGTGDAKALAGLQSIITDNGAAGTVGGLDKALVPWWRNRANTADMAAAIVGDPTLGYLAAPGDGNAIASAPTNGGVLLQALQYHFRQLRRYGAKPNRFYAGSDFIDAMEVEIRANGNYSDTGFTRQQDGSVGEMRFKGVPVTYDPTLDDLSLAKRAYIYDDRDIFLMKMAQEWRRRHSPARPHDYMVLYRSLTSTGQMVARRLSGSLVIDIA